MKPLHRLLADLIEIPSPNPPGDARAIAGFIAEWFHSTDADVRILHPPLKHEAPSVVVTVGNGRSPVIMLHAHIDTVPVADDEAKRWTMDPFRASVHDGRMYGKGSVDDKAPLAAMMNAVASRAQHGGTRGTVVLVAAAEEETGGQLGTRWLAESGNLPAADFIVVGEQTHNQVALSHKGVMRATITTQGKTVHATNPERGTNAITAMARLVLALDEYHRSLASRTHPLVGAATCNVGTISGGSTANAVPDACSIRIDRRMIPRERPEEIEEELRRVVHGVDISPAIAEIGEFQFSSWFDSQLQTELGKRFLSTVRDVTTSSSSPIGYLPGSDAKHLLELARGDMVIFGPGSYEVAHSFDEFVELDALDACEEVLSKFLLDVASIEGGTYAASS